MSDVVSVRLVRDDDTGQHTVVITDHRTDPPTERESPISPEQAATADVYLDMLSSM